MRWDSNFMEQGLKENEKSVIRPFQTAPTVSLSAAHALHDTFSAFLSPLLPKFIEKYLLTKTEAGVLSIFMQLPSLFQPIIGHIMEHKSKKWVAIASPIITSIVMSLLGIAHSYILLVLLLLLAGFSSAWLHATIPVLLGHVAGQKLGKGMGLWMVGGELGRMLGPMIVVFAVGYWGMEGMWKLIIPSVLASIFIAIIIRKIEEKPHMYSSGGHQKLPILTAIMQMRSFLLLLSLIILMRSMMAGAMSVYLPTLMTEAGNTFFMAGISLSIYEAAGIAGAFLGGWLSDYLGRKNTLLLSFSLSPLFMIIFLISNATFQVILLLLLGLTLLSVGPVLMALVQEQFPQNKSLANGTYMALSFTIRSLAIFIIGMIGDLFSLHLSFLISAVLMLMGLPIVAKMASKKSSI